MDHVFGDGKLRATLTQENDTLHLTLADQAAGRTWGPCPLVTLEVYDKAQFRLEELEKFRIDLVEPAANGVHVILSDGFRRISLGLWVSVQDGELVVLVPPSELYEKKTECYRTFSAVILPGLMRAGTGGKMLLPINTGCLCDPADKPKLADRFMIYGEQSRWELLPMLPVAAVQTPTGGLTVLATSGAADMECHVATDGQGSGDLAFGVSFRQNWPDKVDFDRRELRFVPMAPKADPVLTAAKRLRRHVMGDLGKKTLAVRAQESPEVAYLLDAYIMKLFYAVQNEGIMMYGAAKDSPLYFRQVMNFAEAGANLRRLHAAGIDKIHTQSVGWNPRGHDGLWPTRFPIDDRLGGERGFRELIAMGNGLGYRMNVHDNYLSVYKDSPDYNEDQVIWDCYGQPMGLGEWGGGITYIYWVGAMTNEQIGGQMRKVQSLGLTGPGYNDGMGNPLYRNYHPKHRGTRGDYARGVVKIIEASREVYGASGTECGFLYCVIPADSMCTPGSEWHMRLCNPKWPVTAMLDKRVPVWQLALHDLLMMENQAHDWRGTMHAVLFGDHPRTEWSAHPDVMPVLDDKLIGVLKARYDLVLKRFGYLQTQEMTGYQEPADNVAKSTFADGTEVVADFGKLELHVNGKKIDRPQGL